MKVALGLARRGLGNVAPNPAVGCLLVKDGIIYGRGWTQFGGRPHAETCALDIAGEAAKGTTAYVTLEPCAHHGATPPCAEALINAGVREVIIGTNDPDPRVSGQGIALLENAGIPTIVGVVEAQALAVNTGFFNKVSKNRPLFTLKSAASLDGKIATGSGDSKWITGAGARQYGHMVRAQHDAILVGINTVIADNPSLDCRITGLENRSPLPIVLDSKLRINPDCKLVAGVRQRPLTVICNEKAAESDKADFLLKLGVDLIPVSDTKDVLGIANILAARGITRVLVEGGGQVLASFLSAGLCDEWLAFTGPKIVGADGLPSVGKLGLARIADAPHLMLKDIRTFGADLLATYVKAE